MTLIKSHWLTASLLMLITVSWGQAGYIAVKAQLAQYLISDAWQQSLLSQTAVKPWGWADTYPVAKLTINQTEPLYVLAGASNRNLAFGPVLLNANLDELNQVDNFQAFNIPIAAHRDTHFAVLEAVEYGDNIILNVENEKWEFIVDEIMIVDEKNLAVLDDANKQVITLITCYPFNALNSTTPLRYIVQGRLVSESIM